jgi:hypothetical protein
LPGSLLEGLPGKELSEEALEFSRIVLGEAEYISDEKNDN